MASMCYMYTVMCPVNKLYVLIPSPVWAGIELVSDLVTSNNNL